jgi:hypothetical protein
MAERQMRKLNRIYAVLSDPARRTAYEQSRHTRHAPIIVFSGSDGNLKRLLVRGGAVAGIVFGTCLLIWFAVSGNSPSEVRGQDPRSASADKTSDNPDGAGDQISRLRDRLRTAETERDSALEQLGRPGRKPEPAAVKAPVAKAPAPSEKVAVAALTELPSSAATIAGETAVTASPYAGVWVYSKAPGSTASAGGKSQYPPDFIEVTVTERNGALHGQYRSRYQVLGHAISPDVNFDFTGKPKGTALNCAWQGQGGAKGRVTLKLLPASTVEIAWNAIELGSQQWLINGTATLVRK